MEAQKLSDEELESVSGGAGVNLSYVNVGSWWKNSLDQYFEITTGGIRYVYASKYEKTNAGYNVTPNQRLNSMSGLTQTDPADWII